MSISVNISSLSVKGRALLKDVSFTAQNGEISVILGKNGSGKSTLISAISTLYRYEGEITVDGQCISRIKDRERALLLSAVLQKTASPHVTVYDLVALGRYPHISPFSRFSKYDEDAVSKAIKQVNLDSMAERFVDTLSGGELKRAYLAMLLAQSAPNMLLDEITSSLDKDAEGYILSLLQNEVKNSNKCAVLVMHNLDSAVHYADKILLLDGGRQMFFGTPQELLETELLEKTFSVKRYFAGDRYFFA